jgi:hypothetical protein
MVHFLIVPAYIPFETGNTDISNPQRMAVAAGHWDRRVEMPDLWWLCANGILTGQTPPAKECKR